MVTARDMVWIGRDRRAVLLFSMRQVPFTFVEGAHAGTGSAAMRIGARRALEKRKGLLLLPLLMADRGHVQDRRRIVRLKLEALLVFGNRLFLLSLIGIAHRQIETGAIIPRIVRKGET